MSLANEASLLLIPSGYKSGEVYSVFPTDGDGDFTFSRSGNASRVNPGGYIETVGFNIPRIDHIGGGCPSLLLEPTKTNLQIRSEEFDNSAWIKGSATITANNIISPENVLNADKMQRTSSTSQHYVADVLNIGFGSKTVSISIFIKKGIGDFFTFRASQSGGVRVDLIFKYSTKEIISYQGFGGWIAVNSKFEELPNDWFRLNMTLTTSGSSSNLVTYFSSRSSSGVVTDADINSNSNCYLWGAQTEISTFTSSYIKTTSGSVTRQLDKCINGGNADLFNITEGTFFVDVIPFKASTLNRITLSNNTSNEEIIFYFQSNNTQVQIISESGGSIQVSYIENITFDIQNKLAFTFKKNEFKFYVNGNLVHTDTSGNIATGLNSLHFAGNNGGFGYFQGKVHDTRVYNKVLTEAEAIKLTTL
tara:strand:- start:651 stop:1910 length:1260 start_codon:yes stop_codon:yes gene_type:complete